MRRHRMTISILALVALIAFGCDEDDPSESYSPRDCEEVVPTPAFWG